MKFFMKKLFQGKGNGDVCENIEGEEDIHEQFIKFGRGRYEKRYLIEAKKNKNNVKIKTSAEFANELVRNCAEKLKEEKVKVRGIIVSTKDIRNDINFEVKDLKQFMGVKKFIIENEMKGSEILDICEKFSKAFLALSFAGRDFELKIKEKAPKSGKPATKGENDEVKADFCTLITNDAEIIKGMLFDVSEFKNVKISHIIEINNIILPKGEKDFAKIRELAKRKGKIIRDIEVDGRKSRKEVEFEV